MDKLDKLFKRQKELQIILGEDIDRFTEDQAQQYTKDNILSLLDETHEVLREINWKHWKKTKKVIDKDHLKEELTDVFHFFINLCLAWGFTSNEIYDAYLEKDHEIIDRHNRGY